jgi:bacterioferritin-associated ferredoxin
MIMIRMYICICNGITDRAIRECAKAGSCSLSELECSLGVGVSCGRCRDAAAEILQETHSTQGRLAEMQG